MTRIACYPGTFDPVTLGHQDVVAKCCQVFDLVMVLVSENTGKSPMFSVEQRVNMLTRLFQHHDNVEVYSAGGLSIDFAKTKGATALVRGVRNGADADYEVQLSQMNQQLAPEMPTVMIPADSGLQHISATWVRDVIRHGGDVTPFVDPTIASMIQDLHQA